MLLRDASSEFTLKLQHGRFLGQRMPRHVSFVSLMILLGLDFDLQVLGRYEIVGRQRDSFGRFHQLYVEG